TRKSGKTASQKSLQKSCTQLLSCGPVLAQGPSAQGSRTRSRDLSASSGGCRGTRCGCVMRRSGQLPGVDGVADGGVLADYEDFGQEQGGETGRHGLGELAVDPQPLQRGGQAAKADQVGGAD